MSVYSPLRQEREIKQKKEHTGFSSNNNNNNNIHDNVYGAVIMT